jgi:metal-responsive CopG/Arc/MetJ family transcriptional regulator
MVSNRITVRIPSALTTRLRSSSRARGATESELVRAALENYLGHSSADHTAFDLAQETGLIGIVQEAPKDLSTSRRHFDGFGKGKRK